MCYRFLLLAVAGASLSLSSGAHAETLREAVQTALNNHPSVEAAKASHLSSMEERREKKSDFFPVLNANASGGRMYGDNSTSRGLTVSRGAAYSWIWEGNASVTQPIFSGFETVNRVDAASARIFAADYNVSSVEESLALRAVQAYINVLQSRDTLEKTRDYKDKLQDYLGRVEMMVDAGAADEVEAAQARNINLLLANSLSEATGQLESAYAAYVEVVGKMPDGALKKPSVHEEMIFPSVEEALSYTKAHHPSIMAARKESEAAGYDVTAEKGTLYPDLNGELSYLKKDQLEEIGGEIEDRRALLRASWSFSTGGAELARIRRAKADYAEKQARSQEVVRQIEQEVRLAYAQLETARKQSDLAQEREAVTAELFEAYESQFEGARIRLLQLMQADNQLFGAQIEKMNAEYRTLLSEYMTLASTGRLQQSLELAESDVPAAAAPVAEEGGEGEEALEESVPLVKADETLLYKSSLKGVSVSHEQN
ncbi:MAG: TolC family protein [Rhodospirillales bacterium]|nr:TolC family protein [Alphaproteobacteria bacterium]USO02843.1 MAG: TolC family protein [Rhodospirillales bacterium]